MKIRHPSQQSQKDWNIGRIIIALVTLSFVVMYWVVSPPGSSAVAQVPSAPVGHVATPKASTRAPRTLSILDIKIGAMEGASETTLSLLLLPRAAPETVKYLSFLASNNEMDGCAFYRAEPGFCFQGGCGGRRAVTPTNATAQNTLPLEYKVPNYERYVSMARTSNPNSATTEFSIMLRDNSEWLGNTGRSSDRHGYSVFAIVVGGWDEIVRMSLLPTTSQGGIHMLKLPIVMQTVRLRTATFEEGLGNGVAHFRENVERYG